MREDSNARTKTNKTRQRVFVKRRRVPVVRGKEHEQRHKGICKYANRPAQFDFSTG